MFLIMTCPFTADVFCLFQKIAPQSWFDDLTPTTGAGSRSGIYSFGVVTWLMRSEEHTSELQSPDTISYAVFCLKKKIIGMEASYVNLYFLSYYFFQYSEIL